MQPRNENEYRIIKPPKFELWMVDYAPFGEVNSETRIAWFNDWHDAVINAITCRSMLKVCYRDDYVIEIRVVDENSEKEGCE